MNFSAFLNGIESFSNGTSAESNQVSKNQYRQTRSRSKDHGEQEALSTAKRKRNEHTKKKEPRCMDRKPEQTKHQA
jgi:hypothetical protein